MPGVPSDGRAASEMHPPPTERREATSEGLNETTLLQPVSADRRIIIPQRTRPLDIYVDHVPATIVIPAVPVQAKEDDVPELPLGSQRILDDMALARNPSSSRTLSSALLVTPSQSLTNSPPEAHTRPVIFSEDGLSLEGHATVVPSDRDSDDSSGQAQVRPSFSSSRDIPKSCYIILGLKCTSRRFPQTLTIHSLIKVDINKRCEG